MIIKDVTTGEDSTPRGIDGALLVTVAAAQAAPPTQRPAMVHRSNAVLGDGTWLTVSPGTVGRKYLFIQNTSINTLYVNFGDPLTGYDAANDGHSVTLVPGGVFVMEGSYVTDDQVTINGYSGLGQTFTALEG